MCNIHSISFKKYCTICRKYINTNYHLFPGKWREAYFITFSLPRVCKTHHPFPTAQLGCAVVAHKLGIDFRCIKCGLLDLYDTPPSPNRHSCRSWQPTHSHTHTLISNNYEYWFAIAQFQHIDGYLRHCTEKCVHLANQVKMKAKKGEIQIIAFRWKVELNLNSVCTRQPRSSVPVWGSPFAASFPWICNALNLHTQQHLIRLLPAVLRASQNKWRQFVGIAKLNQSLRQILIFILVVLLVCSIYF